MVTVPTGAQVFLSASVPITTILMAVVSVYVTLLTDPRTVLPDPTTATHTTISTQVGQSDTRATMITTLATIEDTTRVIGTGRSRI